MQVSDIVFYEAILIITSPEKCFHDEILDEDIICYDISEENLAISIVKTGEICEPPKLQELQYNEQQSHEELESLRYARNLASANAFIKEYGAE